MKTRFVLIACLLFTPSIAHSAPTVAGVAGQISDSQSIVVTGAGFGDGPTIHFFDDFEGGSVGQNIKTGPGSAKVGQWDSLNTVPPKYSVDTSVSGTQAFKVTTSPSVEGQTNGLITLPDVMETFISWWCYVPTDSPWPGDESGNQFNWKIMWIMQNNSVDNDLYFVKLLNPTTHVISGNNSTLAYPDTEPWQSSSMVKGTWHRYWWWIKDGYANDGYIKAWELTASGLRLLRTVTAKTTLFPDAVRKKLSVNGYTKRMSFTQATQMFDDVYVATGPNAQARIEIGTGCTGGNYSSCTNLSISTVTSWNDTTIVATIRKGSLSGNAHLFIIDGSGTVSTGFPVVIDSGSPLPPTIAVAPETVSNGQSITISGANFGATGPTVAVFDDFNAGANGTPISTNAVVGTWTSKSGAPTYISDGSGFAVLSINEDQLNQLTKTFAGTTELLLSYKLKIPSGYYFPNTSAVNTYASNSSFKAAWIFDGAAGYQGDDDLVLPTWPNGTWWQVSGNDLQVPSDHMIVGNKTTDETFKFGEWNRVLTHLKGGLTPTTDSGRIYFQWATSAGVRAYMENTYPLFDGDDNGVDNGISQWTQLNIPGWHRNLSQGGVVTNVRMLYDDIYLATGPNAQARLEIGTGCTAGAYSACTNLAILPPTSWTNGTVVATVRSNGLLAGDAHLFVVDANGNVSAGYPVTLSASSDDNTPPVIAAFTMPATASALSVAVNSFSATDAIGVTGYMITESSSAPSAGALGWSASAPASFTFSAAGTRTAYAWAKDAAGNVSTSVSRSVTIALTDSIPPAVSISSPISGAILKGSVMLSATASDNVAVTKVEFYLDGTLIGTDTTSPYSISWSTLSIPSGTHTLTAKAYDAAANVTTSAPVSVTVRRIPKAPVIMKLK